MAERGRRSGGRTNTSLRIKCNVPHCVIAPGAAVPTLESAVSAFQRPPRPRPNQEGQQVAPGGRVTISTHNDMGRSGVAWWGLEWLVPQELKRQHHTRERQPDR